MTKKINKKLLLTIFLIIIILIIANRIINGVKIIESDVLEKEDLYFRVTLNDEVINGSTSITKTYNLIPGILKVKKFGYSYLTFDNDFKYTHKRYKLINTENINKLIIKLEVYKCYKNKFISNNCGRETKYFKKKDVNIEEVEIRRIGITSDKYNELVYKGSFNEDIYNYVKETDYYSVKFKYKIGSKIYDIYYDFFTNVLQPEIL